jgi:hypothetical protein
MFALVLFAVSLFASSPTVPTTVSHSSPVTSGPLVTNPPGTLADYPYNFTQVTWDQASVNEYRVDEWNSSRYRFGPAVNWHTRNATDNMVIDWDQEIPLNAWADFIVEVPYNALGGVVPRAVAIQGSYYNLSEMKDGEMQHEDNNPISVLGIYYVPEDRWEVYSSKMTIWPEGPPSDLPENFTLSDVFGPMVDPFLEMDEVASTYVPGAESYWARFRLLFNASTLPGFYMFSAIALDDSFQTVAESTYSETGGRLLGMSLHAIVNQAFGGYYTISRVNDDGDVLYTVSRGEDFNTTVTVSNGTLMDNVTLLMSAPSTIKIQKWVYGQYYETQVRYGAWEWNDGARTYIWNASAEVSWAEPKVGYHWEETYTWVNMGQQYTYYDYWGDWTETRETWPEFAVSYDFESSSWNYYALYHYENSSFIEGKWQWVEWEEYEPWNSDWPVPYVLNETESRVYINGMSKLVVNFRGHISEEMLPSGSEYGQTLHIWERVFNYLGQKLVNYVDLPIAPPQARIDYENQRTLAIETPVSIVKLTHKGEPYSPSWMFQADIGEAFTVTSRLQGGIEHVDDIDGVAFIMYGHQDRWGEEAGTSWWQRSDIEIEVKVGPLGDIEVNVYNYTVRTSWGYGEHYEWVTVKLADGVWDTQRVLVEDWFWQEQVWDFEANDWTDQHFPTKSPQGRMPVSCLMAGNVSYTLIGDDLRAAFDVTPLPEMPSLEWQWDYFYGNLTWVTDYEAGWGSHTVLGWTEDAVYHYYNGTSVSYVESPYKSPIFRNSATGDLYEREKIPYIIIDSNPVPLKTYVFGDMDYTYETLIREDYDYVLEQTRRFIKLYNGSELEVFGDEIAVVYEVMLMNGTTFLSFNEYPEWMGWIEGQDYYYMIRDDGRVVAGTYPMVWDGYTSTRHHVVPVSMLQHTYVAYASPISPFESGKTIPIYMAGWPVSVGPDHWVMYLNRTWEPIDFWRYWEDGSLYYYQNRTDGRIYVFQWPWELMRCGAPHDGLLIPHYATKLYAYVTVGGTNYPIPQAGEPLNGWWDLDWVIQNKYSQNIAYIDGAPYVAKMLEVWNVDHWEPYQEYNATLGYWYNLYDVDVMGTHYNLTDWGWDPYELAYVMSYNYYPDSVPWVTKINGSVFVPEVHHTDWTVAVGATDPDTLEFEPTAWLDLVGGYYDGDYSSSDIGIYWNGTHQVVETSSAEVFVYNSTWRAVFHNITLSDGTFFYSTWDHPNIFPTDVTNWEVDQFYMVDIYGIEHWWTGWDEFTSEVIVITDIVGDPWMGGSFWFDGGYVPVLRYNVTYWDWDGSMWYSNPPHEDLLVWAEYYDYLQAANGTRYEFVPLYQTPESHRFNFPSWQFVYEGTVYNISGSSDMIYKAYQFEGYSQKLDYAPLPVSIIRTQDSIVTGAPEWGMWDMELWDINEDNGALDLDGNLDTTDDQFFVRELHTSTDEYNITQEYLDVMILWDPDNNTYGDEFYLHSFTGMVTFNWNFSWADNYIWTKASTGETLSAAEMDAVRSLLLDQWNNSRPGYWDIAWMANNFTSEDQALKALEEGWDWAVEDTREWSWLWWELDEHYSTEISNGTYSEPMDINLAYQYAGMFAWEDENDDNFMDIDVESLGSAEMSHYWMPVDVDSVSFVTPGMSWGDSSSVGSEYRPVNETIDFGVTFTNVTGIVFPFGSYSYWDWFDGQYYGSDFATFDERPTECMTDEFSMAVHFTGIVNETGSNIAEVKFDITVGDWDLNTPGGTGVLEDVSLAVSFFSDLTIVSGGGGATAAYLDDEGQVLSNEVASASDNYTMAAGMSSVALMSLGGAPYSWSRNMSFPATVTAQTMPLSAMSAIYMSGSGGTATTFSISSEQFYTLIGFKWWDGWSVTVDPIFVGYISHGSSDYDAPSIGTAVHDRYEVGVYDYCHIEVEVTDTGGSDVAEVKVWDIDNNINYSMAFSEISGLWEVDVERTLDGRYDFNYRIVAIDNAGNSAYTTTRTFMFWDNIPPEIGTMSVENGTDGLGREIATVTSAVSDLGGSMIDQVILTYSNATGDYNVSMTFSAGDYVGTIPNHAPTTIVSYWVTVTDGDGNYVQSSILQFVFSTGTGGDVYGPSVSLVSHDPEEPTSSQAVQVSATIVDVSGVDRAVLQYRVDTGEWVNVTMSSAEDIWTAMIPSQADGSTVFYRIVAYDDLGNEAISGEHSYTVHDAVTTSTSSTTGGTGDQTMLLIIGGVGGLVIVVVILAAARRR